MCALKDIFEPHPMRQVISQTRSYYANVHGGVVLTQATQSLRSQAAQIGFTLAARNAVWRNSDMIVDMRIYTTHYNKTAAFVALYKETAWPLQEKYLGKCLGWFTTAEGQLNQCVHLWGYESQADRETRRAAMIADPGWAIYLKRLFELDAFVAQENRILRPTDFSPVK